MEWAHYTGKGKHGQMRHLSVLYDLVERLQAQAVKDGERIKELEAVICGVWSSGLFAKSEQKQFEEIGREIQASTHRDWLRAEKAESALADANASIKTAMDAGYAQGVENTEARAIRRITELEAQVKTITEKCAIKDLRAQSAEAAEQRRADALDDANKKLAEEKRVYSIVASEASDLRLKLSYLQSAQAEDARIAAEKEAVIEAAKQYCVRREYQNVQACREDQNRLADKLEKAVDALAALQSQPKEPKP